MYGIAEDIQNANIASKNKAQRVKKESATTCSESVPRNVLCWSEILWCRLWLQRSTLSILRLNEKLASLVGFTHGKAAGVNLGPAGVITSRTLLDPALVWRQQNHQGLLKTVWYRYFDSS